MGLRKWLTRTHTTYLIVINANMYNLNIFANLFLNLVILCSFLHELVNFACFCMNDYGHLSMFCKISTAVVSG